ncbi:MAG: PAC2 family protein [Candidatus Bathyarchaeia archaeon]
MTCIIKTYEKPALTNPVLIEGLPGIGFVANIAALHIIRELKAKRFAEIRSSSFQDFAITAEDGKARFPVNELYFHKGRNGERDLIILYGNTQALTTVGQYELCGRVLDIADGLGCRYIVTLGGLRKGEKVDTPPKIYCAASDPEALKDASDLGAEIIEGQIFGVAGLLVGLSKLRGMKGFCLLAETPGYYPDASAAREVLRAISKMLRLNVDLSRLDLAVEATRKVLESFALAAQPREEERREEPRFRWHI